jgi:hypothetical protein
MTTTEGDEAPGSVMRIKLGVEAQERIKLELHAAGAALDRQEPSATTRRLRLAMEVFMRDAEGWDRQPPSREQLSLIWEHVGEVWELIRQAGPAMRRRHRHANWPR